MDAQTSAVMAGLDRFAQRIGLVIVESQDGRARRFVAWGREIEYVVLDDGAVRASALVDEEIMATSTKSVEWMQQLMLKAKADERSAHQQTTPSPAGSPQGESGESGVASTGARTSVPSRARFRRRPAQPEHTQPTSAAVPVGGQAQPVRAEPEASREAVRLTDASRRSYPTRPRAPRQPPS
jgi:hypothetical protein